jgi:lipid II:glycine glycyltransferase (peptidoglycan interpeptide bridge formation enzyme)
MRDIRQSPKYAKYLSSLGWQVDRLSNNFYYTKKIPFLGSVLKLQRPQKVILEDIKKLARVNKAFRIIVEPSSQKQAGALKDNGYKKSSNPYLPTKTLTLDLTKSSLVIMKGFKKDARYCLRKVKNIKPAKITVKDMDGFSNSWKSAVSLNRYVPPTSQLTSLKKTFNNDCLVLAINGNSGFDSGAIFLFHDKKVYYWQAFTGKAGRKKLHQYKIIWEGILWAKKKRAAIFDFEGIYDERFPNKSWRGFTHFKESFGGKPIQYPGAFIKTRIPSPF